MLSSFIKVRTFTLPIRVKKEIWHKIKIKSNDVDIGRLRRLCWAADEEHRFIFFKRIADICLFILVIFPELMLSLRLPPKARKSPQEYYQQQGRNFYRLAAEHPAAKIAKLDEVLGEFSEKFDLTRKSLDFISHQYLHFRKQKIFAIEIQMRLI